MCSKNLIKINYKKRKSARPIIMKERRYIKELLEWKMPSFNEFTVPFFQTFKE